eukprot:363738-Chlamydomonas_euryale.AAC.5
MAAPRSHELHGREVTGRISVGGLPAHPPVAEAGPVKGVHRPHQLQKVKTRHGLWQRPALLIEKLQQVGPVNQLPLLVWWKVMRPEAAKLR